MVKVGRWVGMGPGEEMTEEVRWKVMMPESFLFIQDGENGWWDGLKCTKQPTLHIWVTRTRILSEKN
jgi:hypothetical protein